MASTPRNKIVEKCCPLYTASAAAEAEKRETGKSNTQAVLQTDPALRGWKDSRTHGVNYGKITVSLRQLRGRRSLLRLRPWHPTEALARRCEGRGGPRFGTAFIGCSSVREFAQEYPEREVVQTASKFLLRPLRVADAILP